MPRAKTPEQRERRDALIMRLLLAGNSAREISRNKDVALSHTAVNRVIVTQLADSAKHMELLNREALNMYVARLEMLIRSTMPKALNTQAPDQLKAVESVRRILEQQARLYGLDDLQRGNLPLAPANTPGLDTEPGDDEAATNKPPTKLAEYRKRHQA